MQKVIVASTNLVKIEAARLGFVKMFPQDKFEFEGVSVASGVSDQPMTEEETVTGAKNRARNAQNEKPVADYWIGIEGGIGDKDNKMTAFAWIHCISKDGIESTGKTGSFFLPLKVASLIREGKEFSEADDIVFGRENSKQSNGTIGILTNDVITRTSYYTEAIILALIPFKNPELY